MVRRSAPECAKVGVYQGMTEPGLGETDLARRLGWHLPQVVRLFDLNDASRFGLTEAAAGALGVMSGCV